MSDILSSLNDVLKQRKAYGAHADSYVAQLYAKGLNKILQKVGEESCEVILAAKDAATLSSSDDVISETADLLFHLMVMLTHLDIDITQVLAELERRFGTSGIVEKASRSVPEN